MEEEELADGVCGMIETDAVALAHGAHALRKDDIVPDKVVGDAPEARVALEAALEECSAGNSVTSSASGATLNEAFKVAAENFEVLELDAYAEEMEFDESDVACLLVKMYK